MRNAVLQTIFRIASLIACLSQTACLGTTTPQVQEFWGSPDDADAKVRAIVLQVRCELATALYRERYDGGRLDTRLNFLDKWGVQVIMSLSVDEKVAVTPGASIISPMATLSTVTPSGPVTSMQNFMGNIGGVYSNEATALDKTTLFYTVPELVALGPDQGNCVAKSQNNTLFENSDLGIWDWLRRNINIQEFKNSDISASKSASVLSHDIKFEIVTSGNATPTWKLVRFSGNTASPFFLASRDRYEELLITMGQADKVNGLAMPGSTSSLASQINSAVSSTPH